MLNREKFTKLAKSVIKQQKGLRDPRIMHPEREWLAGLGVAGLILVGVVYVSVDNYLKNQDASANKVEAVIESKPVYRETVVKDVISSFREREQKLDSLVREEVTPPVFEEATTTAETSEESPEFNEVADTEAGTSSGDVAGE
jgi:hypothetical protein